MNTIKHFANLFFLLLSSSAIIVSCQSSSSSEMIDHSQLVIKNNDSIVSDTIVEPLPEVKNGKEEVYTITFAEWADKSTNVSCIVIRQDSLFTIINDGSLGGEKGQVIDSGIIRIHKETGQTILSKKPEDVDAPEVGGCTDGPIVVDLVNKIIVFC